MKIFIALDKSYLKILLERSDIDESIYIQNVDYLFEELIKHYQIRQIDEIDDVNIVHQAFEILMGGNLL